MKARIGVAKREVPSAGPAPASIRRKLLAWYDRHRRTLPWRAPAGGRSDPYAVWLSEIMLQQTTVATVVGYFGDFMARWPTVGDLAAADLDDVLHAWQGLGYYARARNLHKCAKAVAADHGGRFPDTEDGLKSLPGIGPYTAAAIAAIAFDRPTMPVDGNIERVTARLFRIATPLPKGKAEIINRSRVFVSTRRPGDFAQAMMDLGATVCTPRSPKCFACPLRTDCRAAAAEIAEDLPARGPKPARPTRRAVAFWLMDKDGRVLIRRRDERGLLGGMMEFPSTPWQEGGWPDAPTILDAAPVRTKWREVPGEVEHVFTHFRLEIRVCAGKTTSRPNDGQFVAPADFGAHALPTVMKKIAAHVRADGG